MNESEVKIEMPVVWNLPYATLHQLGGEVGAASTLRRLLRQENGTEPICGLEFRIERDRDVEQRIEKVIFFRGHNVVTAKVLNGSGPIDVGKQPVVAQAHALQ